MKLRFTKRHDAQQLLEKNRDHHYVYVLGTPNEKPFYVGKGSGNRIFHHEAEARGGTGPSHKRNIIRKILRQGGTLLYCIEGFYECEGPALSREVQLISTIGRHDLGRGPLSNQTDGGEGTVNVSDEALDRRLATLGGSADDPERRAVNDFFAGISGPQPSVPVKPLAKWRAARPLRDTTRKYGPTRRSAGAVVASATASGRLLAPGAILPRCFVIQGAEFIIENGCGDALLKSKMARLREECKRPREEELELTDLGFEFLLGEFGEPTLLDLGILEPQSWTPLT
jgi:hypothetical protein